MEHFVYVWQSKWYLKTFDYYLLIILKTLNSLDASYSQQLQHTKVRSMGFIPGLSRHDPLLSQKLITKLNEII